VGWTSSSVRTTSGNRNPVHVHVHVLLCRPMATDTAAAQNGTHTTGGTPEVRAGGVGRGVGRDGGGDGGASPARVERHGKVIPDVTRATLNLDERLLVEDWSDKYYGHIPPQWRPPLDFMLSEMVRAAARGMERDETSMAGSRDERIERIGGLTK
jgi:hypothetical protein